MTPKPDDALTVEELDRLASMEAKATISPWFQASWKNDMRGNGTELSQLLCFFDDEGEPRFWDYENNGEFVAEIRNFAKRLIAAARRGLEADQIRNTELLATCKDVLITLGPTLNEGKAERRIRDRLITVIAKAEGR